jgi:excisionase family DNA binding protein
VNNDSSVRTVSTRIRVPEICQRLGLSENIVYEMLNEGTIPALRRGRMWLVARHAYEQWEKDFSTNPTLSALPRLAAGS